MALSLSRPLALHAAETIRHRKGKVVCMPKHQAVRHIVGT
jgi:hypothetical protein